MKIDLAGHTVSFIESLSPTGEKLGEGATKNAVNQVLTASASTLTSVAAATVR